MARFYVPHADPEQGILKIEGEEAKHIRKILRLTTGDTITVFDGSGKEVEGTIVETTPSCVTMEVRQAWTLKRNPVSHITLAQSLLKGEKMDFLIQKATELGVDEIVPFISSRSIPCVDKSKTLKRLHRWEKIVIGASKQCGRSVLPRIRFIENYSAMLHLAPQETRRLILWEREGVKLKTIMETIHEHPKIFFVIGPEGGWSQHEVDKASNEGFIPVTLGQSILRAETASLCFLSILQYELGQIG